MARKTDKLAVAEFQLSKSEVDAYRNMFEELPEQH
jgi:hypothetical protein